MAGSIMSATAGTEDEDEDDRASVSTGASLQDQASSGREWEAEVGSQLEVEGVSTCGDRSRTVSVGGGTDTWSSTGARGKQ
jgi:hypothetical protein